MRHNRIGRILTSLVAVVATFVFGMQRPVAAAAVQPQNFDILPDYTYSEWYFPRDAAEDTAAFDEEALDLFSQWVEANTSIVQNPAVRLAYLGPPKRYGVIMNRASDDPMLWSRTPKSDCICGANFDHVTTGLSWRRDSSGPSWDTMDSSGTHSSSDDSDEQGVNETPRKILTHLDPSILGERITNFLSLKVIYELLLEEKSRFAPYLALFSSVRAIKKYWPSHWSEEEKREWVVNSTAHDRMAYSSYGHNKKKEIMDFGKWLCAKYGQSATPLMRRVLCDQDLLLWEIVNEGSRSWKQPGNHDCFVPFQDMFNHGDGGNSLITMTLSGEQWFGMYSLQPMLEGEEATQTYRDDLTHALFFLLNGFVPLEGGIYLSATLRPEAMQIDTAVEQAHMLNCFGALDLMRYHEGRIRGVPFCAITPVTLTCARLYHAKSDKVVRKVMKDYHHRVEHAKNSGIQQNIWFSNTTLDVGRFNVLPVWDELPELDLQAWHLVRAMLLKAQQEIPTAAAYDEHLMTFGSTQTLRNIGLVRVRERLAIERCIAATEAHAGELRLSSSGNSRRQRAPKAARKSSKVQRSKTRRTTPSSIDDEDDDDDRGNTNANDPLNRAESTTKTVAKGFSSRMSSVQRRNELPVDDDRNDEDDPNTEGDTSTRTAKKRKPKKGSRKGSGKRKAKRRSVKRDEL